MDTTGRPEMCQAVSQHGLITALAKHYEPETVASLSPEVSKFAAVSTGTSEADYARLTACIDANPNIPFICADVANGYSEHFVDYVRKLRESFPTKTIMAGNVVTGEMVEELLLSGADIVKVGIGPGSVCTTRMKTGVGYPQLSAVIECADAAHGLGGHIISDGGCTVPGDVAKAFGAGADFVMLGGMFAGHDESGGDVVEKDGKLYKLFYGMSSDTAMKKYAGGLRQPVLLLQDHRADHRIRRSGKLPCLRRQNSHRTLPRTRRKNRARHPRRRPIGMHLCRRRQP